MLTFNSTLTFGKYKGKTLKQIVYNDCDPSYLIWLHNNTQHKLHPNTIAAAINHDNMKEMARADNVWDELDHDVSHGFFGAPPDLDFMI